MSAVKRRQVFIFAGMGLALALIFGSGVWVGRLTAPEGLTLEEMEEYNEEEKKREGSGFAGVPRLDAFQRYSRVLRLNPAQRRTLYPYFADSSRKISTLPARSHERLKVIEELHEKMRSHLDENQKKLAQGILEGARARERE